MQYLVDDKAVIKFIVDGKKTTTNFARENSISPRAFRKVISCEPVNLSIVQKISSATGISPDDLILATVKNSNKNESVQ